MIMASTDMTKEDIKLLREQYEQNMSQCYLKEALSGPWTRNWVQEIKRMIKFSSKLRLAEIELYDKYVKDKYYVSDENNDGQLIRVLKTSGEDLCIPALPWEDAFDVIWKAHVKCGHGNVNQTMQRLRTKYFIEISCVYFVVSLCHICKKKADGAHSKIENVYNKVASLETVSMSSMPDGKHKYLLIYTDEGTGLVQLRACTELACLEIVLKLIEIFTDFGLPKILKVRDTTFSYDSVIETVNNIFDPCHITLETSRLKSTASEVKKMITEWMKEENSQHWEIGCYALQWKINNTNTLGRTPHQLVFENKGLKRSIIDTDSDSNNIRRGPSHAESLPDDCFQTNSQINLFDKTDMAPFETYYKQTISTKPEQMHTNIYDDEFIIEEEDPLKHDNNETVDEFKLDNSSGVKQKACINKKDFNSKQNVMMELIKNQPGCTVIKKEPQSQLDQDSCSSSSGHSDITSSALECDLGIKIEPQSRLIQDSCATSSGHADITNSVFESDLCIKIEPLSQPIPDNFASFSGHDIINSIGFKLEIPSGVSDSATCRECNTEITSEPYNCIKCLKTIHYECGGKVIGSAVDDPIVCWTCERAMKNLIRT